MYISRNSFSMYLFWTSVALSFLIAPTLAGVICVKDCRRLQGLGGDDDNDNHNEEVQRIFKDCANVEYDLAVSVNLAHLMFLAKPATTAAASANDQAHPHQQETKCQPILLHDVTNDASIGKQYYVISHDDKDGQQEFEDNWEQSFPVGMVQLKDLMAAFDRANTSNSDGLGYHLVNNNCATFMLSMWDNLGYKEVDLDLIQYVVSNLSISNTIQDNLGSIATWIGHDVTKNTARDLVQVWVEEYIAQYQDQAGNVM